MTKESLAKTDIVKVEDKKATKGFFKILGEVADAVRSWVGNIGPDLSSSRDVDSLVLKMNECLNPKGGEVSARKNTVSLGNLYLSLSEAGQIKFLQTLAEKFNPDKTKIDEEMKVYKKNQDSESSYKFEQDLIKVLESPRSKILKQFISLPEGLKFIVDKVRPESLRSYCLKGEEFIQKETERILKLIKPDVLPSESTHQ